MQCDKVLFLKGESEGSKRYNRTLTGGATASECNKTSGF